MPFLQVHTCFMENLRIELKIIAISSTTFMIQLIGRVKGLPFTIHQTII